MSEKSEQQGFVCRYRGLIILFALTLVLKVSLLIGTDVVSNDGPTYLNISKQFLDGKLKFTDALRGGYHFYAAAVAIFSKLIPGDAVASLINAGQILAALFSALSIIPFYLLMENIWSSRQAFWGGLIFCVAPGINKYAVDVMRDPGYLLFFLLALYLGWLFMARHRLSLMAGVVFSVFLALMFRAEAFLLAPLLFMWATSAFLRRGRPGNVMLRGMLVVVVIACLGGAVMWYLRSDIGQASRYGEIVGRVSKLAKGEVVGYGPELKKILDSAGRQLEGSAFGNDFFAVVKNHIRTIYLLGVVTLVAKVTWLPFFLLALIGIAWSVRNKSCSWYLLSFLGAYLALGYFYNMQRNFLEERYVYSVVVMLYAHAGYAIAGFQEKCALRVANAPAWILVFSLVAVPATIEAFKDQRKWRSYPFKEAGLWLAAQPGIQQARLVANEQKIPYYAGKFDGYSALPFDVGQMAGKGASLSDYDYVAIEAGDDYKEKIVDLDNFRIVKRVESDRYIAVVYKKVGGAAQ